MITQRQNGVTVTEDKIVYPDGEVVVIPKHVKNSSCTSMTMINGEVYMNGYYYNRDTKQFERTVKALWHKYF
jgi:hypothetical protein